MPRRARIESAGAFYHVLNRGNYRQKVCRVGQSGEQFERTLFEACGRFGWRLHAYVFIGNHYQSGQASSLPVQCRMALGGRAVEANRGWDALLPSLLIMACWIKGQTGVSNRWLSEHVHLGAASGVSRLLQNQRDPAQKSRPLWR